MTIKNYFFPPKCIENVKAIRWIVTEILPYKKTFTKNFKTPKFLKILSLKTLKMTIKNVFFPKNSWDCIVKVFRILYLQYQSNPMRSYWDITIQKQLTILKNFNQKCSRWTDRQTDSPMDRRTCKVLCLHHYHGLTKTTMQYQCLNTYLSIL